MNAEEFKDSRKNGLKGSHLLWSFASLSGKSSFMGKLFSRMPLFNKIPLFFASKYWQVQVLAPGLLALTCEFYISLHTLLSHRVGESLSWTSGDCIIEADHQGVFSWLPTLRPKRDGIKMLEAQGFWIHGSSLMACSVGSQHLHTYDISYAI